MPTDEYDPDEDEARIFSVFSGTKRRDRWRVAAWTTVLTLFGRTFLDMRRAESPADILDVKVWCLFGSVTILVPEGCDVRPSGIAVLAVSDSIVPEVDEPVGFPALDIEANVLFGRVRIATALGAAAPVATSTELPVRRPAPAPTDRADASAAVPVPDDAVSGVSTDAQASAASDASGPAGAVPGEAGEASAKEPDTAGNPREGLEPVDAGDSASATDDEPAASVA